MPCRGAATVRQLQTQVEWWETAGCVQLHQHAKIVAILHRHAKIVAILVLFTVYLLHELKVPDKTRFAGNLYLGLLKPFFPNCCPTV
jgi:hypothetical protein